MSSAMPLLKFTPSAMDTEFLEAITVQREPLIKALVDAALDVEGGRRHHLLVGPRGMGKSHVLTVAAERIRATADESLVLAVLDEDPWATRSYVKFLAAILGALDHPEASTIRSRGTEDEAERLLREAVGDRRLVLIVENLDEIYRRIRTEGQKRFRAFAENWPALLVLGSTPQLFAGINRHASPFYAFFRISHLDELTPENASELLLRIAQRQGDHELAEFLSNETARRRVLAINALAGGHPRIWLLFAGCISIPAIDELVPLFLEALDDLTPYYQSRLAELGDQQQELVLLLCEAGGSLTNRQLAEESGLPQNQVGAALGKLEDRGYVRRALLPEELNTGDARASYWELREPLMRLALDIKHSRGRPLELLVQFLRAWYGARILDELDRLPDTAHLASAYAAEAFRSLDAEVAREELLEGSPQQILVRARRGLELTPENAYLHFALSTALLQTGPEEQGVKAFERGLQLLPDGLFRSAMGVTLNAVRSSIGGPIDAELAAAAIGAFEMAAADDAFNHKVLALAYDQLDRYEEALASWDDAIAIEPDNREHHRQRAEVLLRLGREDDARNTLLAVGGIAFESSTDAFTHALTLREAGLLAEAEAAISYALSLDQPSFYHLLVAAEISSSRDDRERAASRLVSALRDPSRAAPDFSDAYRICHVLWSTGDFGEPLLATIAWFRARDELALLGSALISVIPEMSLASPRSQDWLDAWVSASTGEPALELASRLLSAATAFAQSGDKHVLLSLPREQREIVIELLEGREDRFELGDDVA